MPESSIIITAKDNYSSSLKAMAAVTRSFRRSPRGERGLKCKGLFPITNPADESHNHVTCIFAAPIIYGD